MKGKVLITGLAGDVLLGWLRQRLEERGYEPLIVAAPGEASAASPLTLTPIVAGFDLWRTSGEERFEALADLDERLPPGRPLLSNCAAISVDEVASYAVRPERVVGFSILGSPRDGLLVELLPALGTESGAVQRAAELLVALGLQTATRRSGAWPLAPRILAAMVNEAALALAEGNASAAEIDTALQAGAGLPRGPLALADEIGLGEILAVLEALADEYGHERYHPAPLLRRLVLAGYTGKAAGRGFHLYP